MVGGGGEEGEERVCKGSVERGEPVTGNAGEMAKDVRIRRIVRMFYGGVSPCEQVNNGAASPL